MAVPAGLYLESATVEKPVTLSEAAGARSEAAHTAVL